MLESFFAGRKTKYYCMDCVKDKLGESEGWGVGDVIHVVADDKCENESHDD